MVKTGQVWTGNFTTEDATGALATPSVGPAGVLYVAGVATADVVTISTAATGNYKFSVTLPALTAGQSVAIYITATIATIAKGGFVAQDIGDTKVVSDLNDLSAANVNAEMVDALTVDILADSLPADGTRPTFAQASLAVYLFLMERAVSGTTVIVKKVDGTTTAMTFTLDDAFAPTSITRAT